MGRLSGEQKRVAGSTEALLLTASAIEPAPQASPANNEKRLIMHRTSRVRSSSSEESIFSCGAHLSDAPSRCCKCGTRPGVRHSSSNSDESHQCLGAGSCSSRHSSYSSMQQLSTHCHASTPLQCSNPSVSSSHNQLVETVMVTSATPQLTSGSSSGSASKLGSPTATHDQPSGVTTISSSEKASVGDRSFVKPSKSRPTKKKRPRSSGKPLALPRSKDDNT